MTAHGPAFDQMFDALVCGVVNGAMREGAQGRVALLLCYAAIRARQCGRPWDAVRIKSVGTLSPAALAEARATAKATYDAVGELEPGELKIASDVYAEALKRTGVNLSEGLLQ